jgi:3-phenylpropionate/cinnamic acid dioxygenase small subunit
MLMNVIAQARGAAVLAAALSVLGCATTTSGVATSGEPTLADREAIEATLYNYARGLDRHDVELYASAFAEDAVFDLGVTQYEGRDAMRAIITGLIDGAAAGAERGDPPRQLFHMDANPRVEFLSADHAVYHAYYLTFVRVGEGQGSTIQTVAVGSATDELRKIDGEWLIVKRTVMSGP